MDEFEGKPDLEVPPQRQVTGDDRMWAALAHLSILIGLTSIVGPLVIWLVKRDTSAFVDDQAKEALNFQLSCLIATLATAASCILSPLALVIIVGGIVYGVLAGVEANKGNWYRYPYTFRMIK
ncbi:MAG: DUF4870 domain-containing protein [Planctomycetes bacterium]|nr:DUF4870 domain-containing protein [Planctomycetota bacterium]